MTDLRSDRDCERARALVSLELDGELSEVEEASLAAHRRVCPECEARARELEAITSALRRAPLVRRERGVVALPAHPARRGSVAVRLAAAATLASAAAALGVLAGSGGGEPRPPAARPPEVAFRPASGGDSEFRNLRREKGGQADEPGPPPRLGAGAV